MWKLALTRTLDPIWPTGAYIQWDFLYLGCLHGGYLGLACIRYDTTILSRAQILRGSQHSLLYVSEPKEINEHNWKKKQKPMSLRKTGNGVAVPILARQDLLNSDFDINYPLY